MLCGAAAGLAGPEAPWTPGGNALAAQESSPVSASRRVCVRRWVGEARPVGAGPRARPACPSSPQEGAWKPGLEALAQGCELRQPWRDELLQGPSARRCPGSGACAGGGGGPTAESGQVAPQLVTQLRSCARGRGAGGEMRSQGTLWAGVQRAPELPGQPHLPSPRL